MKGFRFRARVHRARQVPFLGSKMEVCGNPFDRPDLFFCAAPEVIDRARYEKSQDRQKKQEHQKSTILPSHSKTFQLTMSNSSKPFRNLGVWV